MKKILLFFLLTIAVYPQWDFGFGTTGGGAGGGTSRFSAVDLDGGVTSEYAFRNYSAADSFLALNGYERTQLPQSTMKVGFTLGNNGRDSVNTFTSAADTTILAGRLRNWNSYASLASSLIGGKFRITTKSGDVSGITWVSALTVGRVYYVDFKVRLVSGTASALYIGSSTDAGARFLVTPTTEEITYQGTFLALGTTLYMYSAGGANGEVVEFDDIEVREVSNYAKNGNFSTGSSPNPTGWNMTSDPTKVFFDDSKDLIRIVASSSTNAIYQLGGSGDIPYSGIGRRYVITYQIDSVSGNFRTRLGSVTGTTRTTAGVYSDTLIATATDALYFGSADNNPVSALLDNIHVYEIPSYQAGGNHRVGWSKIDALPNSSSDTTSLQIISTGAGNATTSNAYIVSGANTYHSTQSTSKYTLELWARSKGSRGTPTYTADWSAGTDSWTAGNSTLTGGLTISDGTISFDSVMRVSGNGGGVSSVQATKNMGANATNIYRMSFWYLIASGNDTLNQFAITNDAGSPFVIIEQSGNKTTQGAWAYYSFMFRPAQANNIRFYASGTADLYRGSGDTIYFANLQLVPIVQSNLHLHVQGQTKISDTLSVIPGQFEKVVFNFEANSTVADSIRIYLSQSDTLFVDSLNLTQSFDWVTYKWIRPNSTTTSILGAKLASLSNTARGRKISNISGTYYQVLQDNTYKDSVSFGNLGSFEWKFITSVIRHDSVITYVNGVQVNKIARTTGNNNNTSAFALGGLTGGSNYWNGLQGEIMMMRFDNISSSTFSSATPLSVYNSYTRGNGFLDNITSGGKRVVGWWDFTDGTTDALMLMDLSGNGYNLTGNNVTTSDRVNWKR